jgi:hypothetical protein
LKGVFRDSMAPDGIPMDFVIEFSVLANKLRSPDIEIECFDIENSTLTRRHSFTSDKYGENMGKCEPSSTYQRLKLSRIKRTNCEGKKASTCPLHESDILQEEGGAT